jgi:hypothetical protein
MAINTESNSINSAINQIKKLPPIFNSNYSAENRQIIDELSKKILLVRPEITDTKIRFADKAAKIELRFKLGKLVYYKIETSNSTSSSSELSQEELACRPHYEYHWVSNINNKADQKAKWLAFIVLTALTRTYVLRGIDPLTGIFDIVGETTSLMGRCASAIGCAMISNAGTCLGLAAISSIGFLTGIASNYPKFYPKFRF